VYGVPVGPLWEMTFPPSSRFPSRPTGTVLAKRVPASRYRRGGRCSELTIASQPSEIGRREEGPERRASFREASSAARKHRGFFGRRVSFDGKRQFPRPACANGTTLGTGHCPDGPIFRKRALGARESRLPAGPFRQYICSWPGNSGSSRRMDRAVTRRLADPALANISGTFETLRAR
jgi:hypothetical protein